MGFLKCYYQWSLPIQNKEKLHVLNLSGLLIEVTSSRSSIYSISLIPTSRLNRGWLLREIQLHSHCSNVLGNELHLEFFFFISLLSPQNYMKRPIMAAEIEIYCTQSRRDIVLQELKNSIRNGDSSILSDYLYTENRCKLKFSIISFKVLSPKKLQSTRWHEYFWTLSE